MSAARFCGRCGTPIAAGVAFCGRCGARAVGGGITWTPPPAPAGAPGIMATSTMYRPVVSAPQSYHRITSGRLALVAAAALVAVVVAVSALAHVVATPAAPPTCGILSCGATSGVVVTETQDFHSAQLGFDVRFPAEWQQTSAAGDSVTLAIRLPDNTGQLVTIAAARVAGVAAGPSNDQLVSEAAGQLPSSKFSTPTVAYQIPGARVGTVDGSGTMFDTNEIANGAQAQQDRLVVIAATSGSLSIVFVAVAPMNTGAPAPSQIGGSDLLDYLLDQISFPSR